MSLSRRNKKQLNTVVFNEEDFSVLYYEQLLKVNGAGGSGSGGSSGGPSGESSSSSSSSSGPSASSSPSDSSSGGKGSGQSSPSSYNQENPENDKSNHNVGTKIPTNTEKNINNVMTDTDSINKGIVNGQNYEIELNQPMTNKVDLTMYSDSADSKIEGTLYIVQNINGEQTVTSEKITFTGENGYSKVLKLDDYTNVVGIVYDYSVKNENSWDSGIVSWEK